jgi:transcriptional regulator with XRE-family HTH domain
MSYTSFGEKLKHRREELSLTQEEVGAYISEELSRQAVSNWERDEAYPEVKTLLLLSVKLDMSLDEMFADELTNLRQNKESVPPVLDSYPGFITGIRTFAEALKKMNL